MMNRFELLEILRVRRAELDSLLASISAERMTQPGAAGHWSVKDIVSHITAYESWLVEWLSAAAHHTFPAPSPLDDADIERRNARVYEITRSTSLPEVLSDACQTFTRLLIAIKGLPVEYFDDPQRAEWFMKPFWSKMNTVPEAVINLSIDHYEEHIPAIQAWIEESKEIQS